MAEQFAGIRGLAQLQRNVDRLGAKSRKAARLAINDTARWARSQGSQEIRRQVNLKAAYVNKHLNVSKATVDRLVAHVSATKRPVLLSRYSAKQLTRPVKHPKRSTGDPRWGIPPGRKSAGISVRVKAGGSRKKMRKAFFIKLKAGKAHQAGAVGIAFRKGTGRHDYLVTHGPSVAQVWYDVRYHLVKEAEARLAREYERQLRRAL